MVAVYIFGRYGADVSDCGCSSSTVVSGCLCNSVDAIRIATLWTNVPTHTTY